MADRPTRRAIISRPHESEDFVANPVELFFDLAFVIAFAQLVSHLVHHPDVEGVLEAALLFWMLWLPWTQLTWSANAVSAHSRPVQVVLLIATVTSVPMAASIQTALDSSGFVFAATISVILLMGLVLLLLANEPGSGPFKAAIVYSIPNLVAIVCFLGGAALDDKTLRVSTWLLGILVIAGGTVYAASGEWVVRAGHFAERHGLILIIALGEIIVAVAIPVLAALGDDQGLPGETTGSLVFAGLFATILWWAYFDRPQGVFEHRLAGLGSGERAPFARDVYTYLHSLMVAGVILSAAALEEITLHPSDPLPFEFRVMLLLGLGLFIGGIELAVLRAYNVVPPERAIALAALAVLLLVDLDVDGVVLLALVDAVLIVALGFESRRLEHRHTDSPASHVRSD